MTIDAKVFVLDAFCDTASMVKTRVLKASSLLAFGTGLMILGLSNYKRQSIYEEACTRVRSNGRGNYR